MIKRVLVAGAAALALAVSGVANAEALLEGSVEQGKAKAGVCASCHGVDGNSATGQFPKIAEQHATYIYRQLKMFKGGQRKNAIMQGIVANLNEKDMRDLAVYFSQQQIVFGAASPELVQLGRQLFRAGDAERGIPACSGCHGPVGLGNPAASFPRISGQHAEYTAQALQAYRAGERGNYPMGGIMQGVARNLTNEDIQALASYLEGLHEPRDMAENAE